MRGHTQTAPQDAVVRDEDVKLVSFVDLDYPPIARSLQVAGVVIVDLALADDGSVASATALSGAKILVGPTVENAKKWKFRPNAQKRVILVYDFHVDAGGCHDGTRSLFLLRHMNFVSIVGCSNVTPG